MEENSNLDQWINRTTSTNEINSNTDNKTDLDPLGEENINIKIIFKKIHNYLYTNSNLSRNEKLGSELLKIILLKHFDEKWNLEIFNNINNKAKFIKNFKDCFNKKVIPFLIEKGVYNKAQKIELDDESLFYVGKILAEFNLVKNPADTLGAAFEVFAESSLVGDKGQFFTPLDVVRMSIAMLQPNSNEKIIDPACGSGGFLNYAFRWISSQEDLTFEKNHRNISENLFGIDKDNDLVSIAKAFSEVMDINSQNIINRDSLTVQSESDSNLLGQFDVVLTNPPFGSKIKVKDKNILQKFDLAYDWKFNKEKQIWEKKKTIKEREPQILFLELCINLLKPGGRMAIVLPEGIFGNPSMGWVRQYVLSKAKLLAVVDCHQDTFMPSTHTKTSVMFLQKGFEQDYDIFFGIVSNCGHDSRGIPIINHDGTIKEDFTKVQKNYTKHRKRELKKETKLGYTIKNSKLIDNIITPIYYNVDLVNKINKLKNSENFILKSIEELIKEKIITVKNAATTTSKTKYGEGDIPFIRTTDIGNSEILENNVHSISSVIYQKYKYKQDLKELDIIFVKDGTYRIGNSALLFEEDCQILLQSHFKIIRVHNNPLIDPFLFFFLLQTSIVREQIDRNTFVQTTISSIGDRIKNIYLPIPSDPILREELSKSTNKILLERNIFRKKMNEQLISFNERLK